MKLYIPPYRENCVVPLPIKHLISEFPDYGEVRQRIFGINADLQMIMCVPLNGHFKVNNILSFNHIGNSDDI